MNFLRYRIIYFIFSGILVLGCLFVLFFWGLKPGIEFTGGTLIDIGYKDQRPSVDAIKQALAEFDFKNLEIKMIGEKSINLRINEKNISNDLQQQISDKLKTIGEIEENSLQFETISPIIGKELSTKTQIVTILSILVIVLYIAIAFRRVSKPISSWQYGIASLLTLSHDILIPLAAFAVLGKYYDVQITIPVVTALLVIVGYAINDKIVVFDRIRENLLRRRGGMGYEEIVNASLNQTLARCINTSLTVMITLLALYFFGGETLKYFSLTLILGVGFGTYSSLFLASPILVTWLRRRERKIAKR
jgi:preprotein translocase subunit SecF